MVKEMVDVGVGVDVGVDVGVKVKVGEIYMSEVSESLVILITDLYYGGNVGYDILIDDRIVYREFKGSQMNAVLNVCCKIGEL